MGAQQHMRATPALVALSSMLTLSTVELQQLVRQELDENPALEQLENDESICPICSGIIVGIVCGNCRYEDQRLAEASQYDLSISDDPELDPLLSVAAPMSTAERIERDARIALPAKDHMIVRYIVGSLDDQGFLPLTNEELAETLGIPAGDIARIIGKIQEVGPAGVAARSVPECLLLQLDQLEILGTTAPHVRVLITEHWRDLGEARYSEISRMLGISYDEVIAAREFIRKHLRPYPLEATADDESPALALPDVIIREEQGKLTFEVVESRRFTLQVSPMYMQLTQMNGAVEQLSLEERDHLRSHVARARMFLTNLRQRRETMHKLAAVLLDRQAGFIRTGVRALLPLTRAEVANEIGVHESTISRATANKYVQLPNRTLVPFDHFFHVSLSVKDVIRELVSRERHALTDDEIMSALAQQGINIARRTVAKYRGQLGILPSTMR